MWADIWFIAKCIGVLFVFCYFLLWIDDLEKKREKRRKK